MNFAMEMRLPQRPRIPAGGELDLAVTRYRQRVAGVSRPTWNEKMRRTVPMQSRISKVL